MTKVQTAILEAMARLDREVIQRELALSLNKSAPTIHLSIASLIRAGIIQERADAKGVRIFLSLTDKGRALL